MTLSENKTFFLQSMQQRERKVRGQEACDEHELTSRSGFSGRIAHFFRKLDTLNQSSYQLAAKDIELIVKHYAGKNIIFVKNGTKSEKVIRKKQDKIQSEIETFQDNSKKYVFYLQSNFCKENEEKMENDEKMDNFFVSHLLSSRFEKIYPALKSSIKNFLTTEGELRKNLTKDELDLLNKIISNADYRPLFEQAIDEKIEDLNAKKLDVNLTKTECIKEIKAIQNNLKENEHVGYIFTNARQLGEEHIEVLILTPRAIIQPILWPAISLKKSILDTDITESIKQIPVFKTDLSLFVQKNELTPPHPQADRTSCGILSIAFAKKLLQKDVLSTKELSLTMSFYFKEKKQYFFFPPPTLLCYSQSSRYIDFLEAIIQDQETFVYQDQPILTIKALLNQSIAYAEKINDSVVLQDNKSTLAQLNSLRTSWLTKSQHVKEKRNAMKLGEKNLYLNYTGFRFFSLNEMQHEESSSTENKTDKKNKTSKP